MGSSPVAVRRDGVYSPQITRWVEEVFVAAVNLS